MEKKKHSLNFPARKWLPLSSKRNTVNALQQMEVTGWDWLKAYGPNQNQDIDDDIHSVENTEDMDMAEKSIEKERSRNAQKGPVKTLDDVLNMQLDTSINDTHKKQRQYSKMDIPINNSTISIENQKPDSKGRT